jgi:membrane protease subunit (stomatin/prohibitin family)
MMLGGVGFQAGLDEARRKKIAAQQQQAAQAPRPDVAAQLTQLKALHDEGFLTTEELQAAKRKVLGD